tara:strand:+ start:115 stop:966 length:852 start_codon:yes stop_codon:yes gene_type:complete
MISDEIKSEIAIEMDFIDKVFPGTQPVSLDYTNISNISNDYVVSLKYDGIRKMLYSKNKKTFLFDRKYCSESSDILFTNELTILDGEEVNKMFIIFDCIVINGINVKNFTLNERMEKLKSFIIQSGISLKLKTFYPICDFDAMIKIKDIPHDGYVFTNIKNIYKAGRDESLYKYKDGKQNTIDFACFRNQDAYELYCGELGRDVIWIGYALNKHNLELSGEKSIVECYWDDSSYSWVMKNERKDKNNANDIKIVRWNIRTIENNIDLNDLIQIIRQRAGSRCL